MLGFLFGWEDSDLLEESERVVFTVLLVGDRFSRYLHMLPLPQRLAEELGELVASDDGIVGDFRPQLEVALQTGLAIIFEVRPKSRPGMDYSCHVLPVVAQGVLSSAAGFGGCREAGRDLGLVSLLRFRPRGIDRHYQQGESYRQQQGFQDEKEAVEFFSAMVSHTFIPKRRAR